jgi:ADP-heptose:LPS heptosyltransferase
MLPNTYRFSKILVFRPNALGDFIFVLPALQALKETFPHAELVYAGNQWHKHFLIRGRTAVDRVEVVPKVLGTQEENRDFLDRMRREQFDVALQVYGGGKWSNPMVKALGARMTAGLQASSAESLDISVPYIYYENEYLRYLSVVKRVGAVTNHIEPKIRVMESDRELLGSVSHQYVVLHPGASDIRRRWSAKRFAQIGDWCYQHGYGVWITGVTNECGNVEKVLKAMVSPGKNLCGKLTLAEMTGLVAGASLLISNDTGPFHLAYALGTPVVGIFWGPNLINAAPLDLTIARTLPSWQMTCPLCGFNMVEAEKPLSSRENNCDHTVSFVDEVGVEEVIYEIKDMIGF